MTVVQSILAQASRLSVLRQHDVLVSFDTLRQLIRIAEDQNNDGIVRNMERRVWHDMNRDGRYRRGPTGLPGNTSDGTLSGGALISVDGTPSVIFRRDGSASSDLRIYLRDRGGDARFARAVRLTAASARVDAYQWNARTSSWRRVSE